MKKFKRTVAGISALTFALGLTACGGGNSTDGGETSAATTTEATTTAETTTATMASEDVEAISGAAALLRDETLESKTIKFLSHWDINPVEGESLPVQLSLFQDKYDCRIEWVPTTWETRYSDLSTHVLGGTGVDFFPRDEECLPKGVINGMFQPVDDYIDLDSDLWADVKVAMDKYNFNGKHYAFITGVSANNVVIYNKQTIEEYGFDDPWELYEAGEWNWDTFSNMLQTFVEADPDNNCGLDGWWSELALYRSGGEAFIEAKNGEIVVNMQSQKIEKAMNFMLDLYNRGLVMDKALYDWAEQPQFMSEGRELFYITGSWAIMNPPESWSTKIPPENLGIAPVPNSADAEHPWQDAVLDGFCLTRGAQNPLGVALYAECGLAAANDEGAKAVYDKQCREDYLWPEDVIEHRYVINDLARQYPVVDLAGGMSSDIESLTTSNANKSVGLNAALHGVEWATTREELSGAIDVLVAEVVEGLEKAQNE
ncbi:MAG: extracellular solute-binding protein [Oscillospiraceae bacterium]|nr:extracellular solute-binding protein [Oscillospiraceae bacterium]